MRNLRSQPRRPRRRKGFTLIEILLAMAILVILGSIVTVSVIRLQRNAQMDGARTQVKTLQTAVQAYQLAVGTCPSTQQGLDALRNPPADLRNPAKWTGPYMDKEIPSDPWGNPYQYEQVSADQFRIWSAGPDGGSGTEDDITSDS
jgi:general secretion pathway protein G